MPVKFYSSIQAIGKEVWSQLSCDDYPFTRYEFLSALETGSPSDEAACCRDSGWQPHHLVISDEKDQAIAAMPLYLKYHSFGEYIFDWAWADAYQRNGLNYYPKLLSAIPFTPCTGPRLLINPEFSTTDIVEKAVGAITDEQNRLGLSSSHFLFTSKDLAQRLSDIQLQENKQHREHRQLLRESVQYHWFNRPEKPYFDFEDFLHEFKSRKRKSVNKEREQVKENGLHIKRLRGKEISNELWQRFFCFYQITYAKRSGHGGYLPRHFFEALGQTMPDQLMMAVAFKNAELETADNAIAAALFFYSSECLYGRYWGCSEESELLHFELCYYQGLEFCIENQLKKFDAGAQGEHKIQRGFVPVKTYSSHAIAHPQFHDAIARFIEQEKQHNNAYIRESGKYLPYKQTDS